MRRLRSHGFPRSTVLRIHPDGALTHLGEGVLPKSEWKWHAGQKAKDGNIYVVPANAERVLKIEPAENRVSLIGPTFTHTKNKWYGGITAIDGSIWGMPFNAPAALKIVPSTGEVYEVGNVPIGGYKWHGGARCGEYIVGIPSHSMSVQSVTFSISGLASTEVVSRFHEGVGTNSTHLQCNSRFCYAC